MKNKYKHLPDLDGVDIVAIIFILGWVIVNIIEALK